MSERSITSNRRPGRALLLALTTAVILASVQASSAELPTAEELLADMPFSDEETKRILAGKLVTTSLIEETSNRELGIGMAFLIQNPPEDIVEQFRTGTSYKEDKMATAYGELAADATVAAFADAHLTPSTDKATKLYLDASPGKALNLDGDEIAAFQAIAKSASSSDGSTGQVEEQIRKMLLARHEAYRSKGLAGISPYVRDGGKKFEPGDDLVRGVKGDTPVLEKQAPAFYGVLLKYPDAKPEGFRETFFWINFNIDDLPTFALTHMMGMPVGDGYILSDRHYYVSRSHNVIHIVAAVLPAKQGTIIFYSNRTSTDQVADFGSSTKHSIGRKIMAKQIAALFEKLRTDAARD